MLAFCIVRTSMELTSHRPLTLAHFMATECGMFSNLLRLNVTWRHLKDKLLLATFLPRIKVGDRDIH
jgi:hypothetical protein